LKPDVVFTTPTLSLGLCLWKQNVSREGEAYIKKGEALMDAY